MKILLKSLVAMLLVVFILSCESDPIAIGEGILPDGDKLTLAEYDSELGGWKQNSKSYYYDSLNFGSSTKILLGNFNSTQNSYDITTKMLVEWYIVLEDSVVEAIRDGVVQVTNSWITLHPAYNIENYDQLNFSVHRINDSWLPTNFNVDSLEALEPYIDLGTNSFLSFNEKSDSLVSFNITNTLAQSWLDVKADTSLTDNNGILFIPSSSMQSTFGFYSTNKLNTALNPTLYIAFDSKGDFEYRDTLVSTLVLSDVHVNELVTGDLGLNENSNIVFHSGISARADFFMDLSEIPFNAVINKAELLFVADSTNIISGIPTSDTLYAIAYADSTQRILTGSLIPAVFYNKDGIFTGDVTGMVQGWISGIENQGITLSLSDEERSVSRVEIFGSANPDSTLRPKLKLVYTTIPGQ